MNEVRLIDANALKAKLPEPISIKQDWVYRTLCDFIDNAPTVEPNNEYGAIQYSNGFNDGFTTAKDTIIHNIAKQYSAHNELVPEWLSIGDMQGGAE